MKTISSLEAVANNLRLLILATTSRAGSGHPTSCFSSVEICTSLFFHVMHYDPYAYEYPNNDRFILSKGHAAPLLYAIWSELGLVTQEELATFRQIDSNLEGHPTTRFPHVEAATGSLGQGLAIGLGESLAAQKNTLNYRTFVLMGDSELSEGSVWEAAQLAAHYKANNLIAYVDANRLGQRGQSLLGTDYTACANQWRAFGWDAHIVNGHDLEELITIGEQVRTSAQKPTIIIAKTIKGYGLGKDIEDTPGYHGKTFSLDFAATYKKNHTYQKTAHTITPPALQARTTLRTTPQIPAMTDIFSTATRAAYGLALQKLGAMYSDLLVLDAEVKNSTFSELFETTFPDRFVECFIAEQAMISVATGLARRGFTPFCSTFAAFLTRAFDQLRMAAISQIPLRICGSHAGVSIGEDGPSQMGLEDIALMRLLPNSKIFYPADIYTTEACVKKMYMHNSGISYLRTTREPTPILYTGETTFDDGYHVLKKSDHDQACIIAAGITVFEALKAAEELQKKQISVRVVDCYQIKPLPSNGLTKEIRACNGKVLIAEDHYAAGGLGESICSEIKTITNVIHCAIKQLPRSGKPAALRHLMGIDAHTIEQNIQNMLNI